MAFEAMLRTPACSLSSAFFGEPLRSTDALLSTDRKHKRKRVCVRACVRASKHNSESFFLHFYLKRWVYRVKWFNCFFCSTDLIIVRFLKLHLGSL